MSPRKVFLSLLILLVFPGLVFAYQGYVQNFSNSATATWSDGSISVSRELIAPDGAESLSPLSVRRAVSSARKQLLDIILSTRIDSRRTVSAYLSDDAALAARVRGVVQNSPLERPAMFETSGEVRVFEAFRGKLAELVLPTTIPFQSGIPPKLSTSMEQRFEYEGGNPDSVKTEAFGYTGVIIDARDLPVTPCLTPVIYGQDGVGAYGAFLVSRVNAIKHGVVAYVETADPAALKSRVGGNPLVVRAVNTYGSWRTDLIVSSSMGDLVRATMSSPNLMGNSRVVIVLSPEGVSEEDQLAEEQSGN